MDIDCFEAIFGLKFLAGYCCTCKEAEESVDSHPYGKAKWLWHFLFSLFGILWVLPYLVKDLVMGWNGNFVGKKRRKV